MHFLASFSKIPSSVGTLARVLKNQHIFIVFIVSFVLCCVFVAPIFFVFYIIRAPLLVAVIIYLTLLLLSLGYSLYIFCRSLFHTTHHDPFRLLNQLNIVKYVLIILIIFLAGDFIIASYIRSLALSDVDTYYHITRILTMLTDGHFTITSGFFADVPDSSYHMNFVYALYAIPAKLFNYPPLSVWEHSFGYFRLIQWLSIFTLSYAIFRRWLTAKNATLWASLATIIAIPLYSYFFYTAPYPNTVATVWIVAFIITLISYLERPRPGVLVGLFAIAFLITNTHPTYALMTALFLSYWYVVRLLLYKRGQITQEVKKTWPLLCGVLVLMIGPVITALLPSRLTAEQQILGAPATVDFLFLSVQHPQRLLPRSSFGWFSLILSTGGFIYLANKWRWRNEDRASILIALVSFVAVIYWIPPIFTLLRIILPIWVIERFVAMNVLKFILPFTGLAALSSGLITLVRHLQKRKLKIKTAYKINIIVMTMASLVFVVTVAPDTYRQLFSLRAGNHFAYEYTDTIRDGLTAIIPPKSRLLTDGRLSYELPAILPVNVVAVTQGHSPMAADTKHRLICREEVYESLRYEDLDFIGVDFVIISKFDSNIDKMNELVANRPYLQTVATVADLTVYKFNKDSEKLQNTTDKYVYPACIEYLKNESGKAS